MSHGEERNQHLQASYDGLRDFVPVDIYDHNIVSTKGLINVLKILQNLTGFGDPTHRRHGHYSFLHVEVKSSGCYFECSVTPQPWRPFVMISVLYLGSGMP